MNFAIASFAVKCFFHPIFPVDIGLAATRGDGVDILAADNLTSLLNQLSVAQALSFVTSESLNPQPSKPFMAE